jgi:hypothetical protein
MLMIRTRKKKRGVQIRKPSYDLTYDLTETFDLTETLKIIKSNLESAAELLFSPWPPNNPILGSNFFNCSQTHNDPKIVQVQQR